MLPLTHYGMLTFIHYMSTEYMIFISNLGVSSGTQTHGLVVPNHAFYQLNYTHILIGVPSGT